MKQSLNVAIFGLSQNAAEEMQQKVLMALPDSVAVKWCNIADEQIDLLLVNEVFFSSNKIQNIILNQKTAYLRLQKLLEQAGRIAGDVLYYPAGQADDLMHWIQSKFFDYHEPAGQYAVQASPSDAVDCLRTLQPVLDEVFRNRNGFIQLMGAQGCLALIDTRTERVWLNDENAQLCFDSNLSQMYATSKFVQEFTKSRPVMDLKVWLWPVLRRSRITGSNIELQHCFKLNEWPQFEKGFERRNLLKIAACFAQGAKAADVQKYLALPDESIEQFVSIMLLTRLGERIEADEAAFSLNRSDSENSQSRKIKSFFGKLRKKLGL